MKNIMKRIGICALALGMIFITTACGKGSGNDKVVIYTNSDEEVIAAMEKALNNGGYEGEYILQSYGTSELGGKLMAEGDKIDANIITMSSYFVESAQNQNNMFQDIAFEVNSLQEHPTYTVPILANTGSLFVNTNLIKEKNLPMPTSIKDLTKPEFENLISIPNVLDSSTAWLLVQAVISEYGEEEGEQVLRDLVKNCGPHLESSGSGPIKKVRAGEVAVGFGLRHQAIRDEKEGMPILHVDPIEGNYTLTESIAVVKKDDEITKKAQKMAEIIVKEGRKDLVKDYPVALYEGETVDESNKASYSKNFKESLTVELLKEHQEIFKKARE